MTPPWVSRVTSWGLAILLCYVAVVPHRYVELGPEAVWLVRGMAWAPALVLCGLAALLVRSWDARAPIVSLAGIWVALGVAGAAGGEAPLLGLTRVAYYSVTGVLLSLLLIFSRPERRDLHLILRLGMVASVAVALYGLFEFWTQSNPIYGSSFSVSNPRYAHFARDVFGRRIRSTVGHPVYLGGFLAMMLPIVLHTTLVGRGVARSMGALGVGSLIVGLLLTFTRGAYAAAFVGLVVYLSGRATRQVLIVLAAVGLIASVTFSSNRVWETLAGRQTLRQLENLRTDQRGVAYWQSTALLAESPLLGIGSGHYRFLARRHQDWNDTPDNMHLRLLAETGLAGYVVFAMICVSVFTHLRVSQRRLQDPRDRDLSRAITAALVGALFDMVTCDALYFPLTRVTFWLFVGCGIGLSQIHDTAASGKRVALV